MSDYKITYLDKWSPLFLLFPKFRFCRFTATTFGRKTILIKKWLWTGADKRSQDELIVHESIHLTQKRLAGLYVFRLRYMFDRQFRYSMELEAYCEGLKFLYRNDATFVIENLDTLLQTRAGLMSGPAYNLFPGCRMVDYTIAYRDMLVVMATLIKATNTELKKMLGD